MKSFNEFIADKEAELSEMFTNPTTIRWAKTNGSGQWKGDFFIGDKRYILNFVKMDAQMPWEIVFDLVQNGKKTQNITGTGDAVQVFSTVLSGIKQWMKAVNPPSFILSAREPSRQSLYRRMLQMLPKKIWSVEDLGTSFYVTNKTIEQPKYSGFSDSDFDDYSDD
jgi:hypothetical protein